MGTRVFGTRTLRQKRAIEGFLFVVPWIVGFFLFVAWPMFTSLRISFTKVNIANFSTRFLGLAHYKRIFVLDINVVPALLGTLRDIVIQTPIIIVFSLSIAILLNKKLKGQGILRALFFFPVVISSGYVMQELLNQGIGGLSMALGVQSGADTLVSAAGAQAAGEVIAAQTPSVVNVSDFLIRFVGPQIAEGINEFLNRLGLTLWRAGLQILLFIAGLQGISPSLYEAGRIDGANEWTLFWKVTLPVISPIMFAVFIFTIVDSFTDVFNRILHIVKGYFSDGNYGYGAAISWLYFMMIFVLIMLVLFAIRKRVFYQGG